MPSFTVAQTMVITSFLQDYSQIKHRISVDTSADYRFMQAVYDRWYSENAQNTIVDLSWVQEQLLSDKGLRSINLHVHQKKQLLFSLLKVPWIYQRRDTKEMIPYLPKSQSKTQTKKKKRIYRVSCSSPMFIASYTAITFALVPSALLLSMQR